MQLCGVLALVLMAGACTATATRAAERAAVPASTPSANALPRGTSTFVIHGMDVDDIRMLSLEGTPEAMGPGDVIDLDGLLVMVPGPGAYELRVMPDQGNHVLHVGPGRQADTVGVVLDMRVDEDELILDDPLATMNTEQIRAMWGVRVEAWSEDIAASLQRIDPMRTCVVLTTAIAEHTGGALPPLPQGLRCLAIRSDFNNEFKDYSALAAQTELRYFELDAMGATDAFDARLLTSSPHLHYLQIEESEVEHVQALAALAELRVLELPRTKLTDISFVGALQSLVRLDLSSNDITDLAALTQDRSALAALRYLDLSRTQIRDLTPIVALPRLETLYAGDVPATRLPRRRLPALRSAYLMLSKLSDEEVAAFASHNPDCDIRHRSRPLLQEALRGVTRLRVHDASGCAADDEPESFEVSDPRVIAQVIATIEFEEPIYAIHWSSCGELSLDFYRGDTLAVSLGFSPGNVLSWSEFPGDVTLAPASAENLANWLAQRGASGPRNTLLQQQAERQRYQRKLSRSLAHLPEELRQGFFEDDFAERFEAAVPAAGDRVAALLAVYGASNAWYLQEDIEQAAKRRLDAYPAEVLRAQVRAALLGKHRHRRRGAARYWAWTPQTPLANWRPRDAGTLIAAVLTVQQEARDTSTRATQIDTLRRWHGSLPAREFDRRMERALRDPEPAIRYEAMELVLELRHERSLPHLVALVRGKPPAPVALAEVPPDEVDGVSTETLWQTEQPADWDRFTAALFLGLLDHAPAKTHIETALEAGKKTGDSRLAHEVALALLGDHHRLAPAHFKAKIRYVTLAAVEVVVRTRGAHGLGMALQAITHERLASEAFDRLKPMLLTSLQGKPPGRERIEAATSLSDLAAWYSEFGQQYIERLEAR